MAEGTSNVFAEMRDVGTASYANFHDTYSDFLKSDNKGEQVCEFLGDTMKKAAPYAKGALKTVTSVAMAPAAMIGAAYDVYAKSTVDTGLNSAKDSISAFKQSVNDKWGQFREGVSERTTRLGDTVRELAGVYNISRDTGLHRDEVKAGLAGQTMEDYYGEQYDSHVDTVASSASSFVSRDNYIKSRMTSLASYHNQTYDEYTAETDDGRACDVHIKDSMSSVGMYGEESAQGYTRQRDWSSRPVGLKPLEIDTDGLTGPMADPLGGFEPKLDGVEPVGFTPGIDVDPIRGGSVDKGFDFPSKMPFGIDVTMDVDSAMAAASDAIASAAQTATDKVTDGKLSDEPQASEPELGL